MNILTELKKLEDKSYDLLQLDDPDFADVSDDLEAIWHESRTYAGLIQKALLNVDGITFVLEFIKHNNELLAAL